MEISSISHAKKQSGRYSLHMTLVNVVIQLNNYKLMQYRAKKYNPEDLTPCFLSDLSLVPLTLAIPI